MSINNYTGLVSAVQEALEDNSDETLSYIPTAIEIAQLRITRESDAQWLTAVATVAGTSGSRFLSKPSGYLIGQTVSFVTNEGEIKVLVKNTRSYLEKYWVWGASSVGEPKYYADYNAFQYIIAPTPDSNYNYDVAFISRPVGISAGNETNVIINNVPECLFFATMSEMAKFSRNEYLLQTYENQYASAMIASNNMDRRARRDEGLAPLNTNPQMNTLKGDN